MRLATFLILVLVTASSAQNMPPGFRQGPSGPPPRQPARVVPRTPLWEPGVSLGVGMPHLLGLQSGGGNREVRSTLVVENGSRRRVDVLREIARCRGLSFSATKIHDGMFNDGYSIVVSGPEAAAREYEELVRAAYR